MLLRSGPLLEIVLLLLRLNEMPNPFVTLLLRTRCTVVLIARILLLPCTTIPLLLLPLLFLAVELLSTISLSVRCVCTVISSVPKLRANGWSRILSLPADFLGLSSGDLFVL